MGRDRHCVRVEACLSVRTFLFGINRKSKCCWRIGCKGAAVLRRNTARHCA
jgi:hypothetical protein